MKPIARAMPLALITWAACGLLFVGFAATAALLPSALPDEQVPTTVVEEQQTRTALAARQVQASLDSGVSDLLAVDLGLRSLPDPDTAGRLLTQLLATRTRYRAAMLVSPNGQVLARAGDPIDSAVTPADRPTLAVAPANGVRPRVQVSVPLSGPQPGRLVTEFKPEVLIRPLGLAGPGNTRLIDSAQRVVAASTGFTAFEPLSRPDLDRAAVAARTGPGASVGSVGGARHVISWAPVASADPTRQLGLAVVTDRDDRTLALAHTAERRQLVLLATLILAATVIVFGWLYAAVVHPVRQLARSAGKLIDGQTRDAVIVHREDEVGAVARDLERARRESVGRP